jgi:hypothetical protein
MALSAIVKADQDSKKTPFFLENRGQAPTPNIAKSSIMASSAIVKADKDSKKAHISYRTGDRTGHQLR